MVGSSPLSKEDVKKLLLNFYKLSGGKDQLTFVNFKENVKFGKKHCHSLFRHLDDSKKGSVMFKEYAKKMIPKIGQPQLSKLMVWAEDFQKQYLGIFSISDKEGKGDFKMPLFVYQYIDSLFTHLDKKRQGFLTFEQLDNAFSQTTEDEIRKKLVEYGDGVAIDQAGFRTMLMPRGCK